MIDKELLVVRVVVTGPAKAGKTTIAEIIYRALHRAGLATERALTEPRNQAHSLRRLEAITKSVKVIVEEQQLNREPHQGGHQMLAKAGASHVRGRLREELQQRVRELEAALNEARSQLRALREQEDAQGYTCPRRMGHHGPWKSEPGLDGWDALPNGDRTCTFCGSLHPDDVIRLTASPEVSWEKASGKNYKLYVRQLGVSNASEGGIKFYLWHAPDEQAFFYALDNALLTRPVRT
jgi:hypothetical protein